MKTILLVKIIIIFFLLFVSSKTNAQGESLSPPPQDWLQGYPVMRTNISVSELNSLLQSSNGSATIRMSGLGWSFVSVGGVRLDETRRLDPGWTYYKNNAYYTTFDEELVSQTILQALANNQGRSQHIDFTVFLGGGHFTNDWYITHKNLEQSLLWFELYFGSTLYRSSSQTSLWFCTRQSPIVGASVYGGERYNANYEGFPSNLVQWSVCPNATSYNYTSTPRIISPQEPMQPIRIQQILNPIRNWTNNNNNSSNPTTTKIFFDFGQNFAGVLRVSLFNPSQSCGGTTMVLQHAELLWPNNNTLNRVNLGMANATDYYTFSLLPSQQQKKVTSYQPEFTYHGFRYASVEIENSCKFSSLQVQGVFIHSNVTQRSFFETSIPIIQKIHEATLWSQKSNLYSLPTDCPNRDERLFWNCDASLSSDEANTNFDMLDFYTQAVSQVMAPSINYKGEIPDFAPACHPEDNSVMTVCNRPWERPADPAWGSAFLIIPYNTWKHTGNTKILSDNFVLFTELVTSMTNQVNSTTGVLDFGLFGDWYAISKVKTAIVSTYYLFTVQRLMTKICKILAATLPEAQIQILRWEQASAATKKAFNAAFFNESACLYDKTQKGFQTANLLPVYSMFGHADEADLDENDYLVPSLSLKQCVVKNLVEQYIIPGDVCDPGNGDHCTSPGRTNPGHISCGITGAQMLFPVLSQNGYHELAVNMSQQTTYPSWGYMIASGATTLWEHWQNVFLPAEDASHNHIMFGSIDAWIQQEFAGLRIQSKISSSPDGEKSVVADCRNVCVHKEHYVSVSSIVQKKGNQVKRISLRHDPMHEESGIVVSRIELEGMQEGEVRILMKADSRRLKAVKLENGKILIRIETKCYF